jgi:branched-subunit amino acid aminotransferase/4-amino-4-deoxychorismate lyase
VSLADLYAAQGAAVLTAGRGVIPIASVDGHAIARDATFDELQTVWRALP